MTAAPGDNNVSGFFERHCRLVNAPGDQGVENVGDGHQTRSDRNVVPFQAVRVTATVSLFMVPAGDLFGDIQEVDGLVGIFFRHFNGV